MQEVSDDAYDEFCACTTGNRTVLHRGYLFARNIGRPRNRCFQSMDRELGLVKGVIYQKTRDCPLVSLR